MQLLAKMRVAYAKQDMSEYIRLDIVLHSSF